MQTGLREQRPGRGTRMEGGERGWPGAGETVRPGFPLGFTCRTGSCSAVPSPPHRPRSRLHRGDPPTPRRPFLPKGRGRGASLESLHQRRGPAPRDLTGQTAAAPPGGEREARAPRRGHVRGPAGEPAAGVGSGRRALPGARLAPTHPPSRRQRPVSSREECRHPGSPLGSGPRRPGSRYRRPIPPPPTARAPSAAPPRAS